MAPYPSTGPDPDNGNRGLMSYQASIVDQYELLNTTWMSDPVAPEAPANTTWWLAKTANQAPTVKEAA